MVSNFVQSFRNNFPSSRAIKPLILGLSGVLKRVARVLKRVARVLKRVATH